MAEITLTNGMTVDTELIAWARFREKPLELEIIRGDDWPVIVIRGECAREDAALLDDTRLREGARFKFVRPDGHC
jgi:hypothetical protein